MKKRFFILMAVLGFFAIAANAQDVFKKGDIVGNVQLGIGSYSGHRMTFPPTSLSVDVGAFDKLIQGNNGSIGIGGYFGIANYRYRGTESSYEYTENMLRMCFGARGTFHYQFVDNLDTYAGVMFGLYTYNGKHRGELDGKPLKEYTSSSVGFATSVFAGARYYFSDAFGVSAEAGYGFAYLSAGITFKF